MKELTTLVNKILTFRHATRTSKGVCHETNKKKQNKQTKERLLAKNIPANFREYLQTVPSVIYKLKSN